MQKVLFSLRQVVNFAAKDEYNYDMDNSILQLLTQLFSQNQTGQQPPHSAPNESAGSYPPEAFFTQNTSTQNQPSHNQIMGGNMMSILSSLLTKGDNPLASLLNTNKKEEEKSSSVKDEILL